MQEEKITLNNYQAELIIKKYNEIKIKNPKWNDEIVEYIIEYILDYQMHFLKVQIEYYNNLNISNFEIKISKEKILYLENQMNIKIIDEKIKRLK